MSARVLRALPMTFVVYVVEALLAAYAVLPGALEVAPGLAASPGPRLEALRIDAILALAGAGRVALRNVALSLLAVVVLGAFLQMSWLSALSSPASVQRCFAQGARRMPRAWLVSLGTLIPLIVALVPGVGAGYLVHRFVADDRAHDLMLGGAGALVGLGLFWGHTVHDLARARALARRAGASVVLGVRASFRPRLGARALLAFVFGLALPAAATWAASVVATRPYGVLLGLLLLQSALLGRLVIRSWWLASAVAASEAATVSSVSGTS